MNNENIDNTHDDEDNGNNYIIMVNNNDDNNVDNNKDYNDDNNDINTIKNRSRISDNSRNSNFVIMIQIISIIKSRMMMLTSSLNINRRYTCLSHGLIVADLAVSLRKNNAN